MKLSQKFADFNSEVNQSVPYIVANAAAMQLDASIATVAGNFLTDWNKKWGKYSVVATHTEQSVYDIGTAYHLFHPFMEGVKKQLKANKNYTLTGDDVKQIHIHVDAPRRTRIPRPVISPVNTVLEQKHLVVTIFTSNPNPPHEKDEKMPVDVSKIGRKLAVVPAVTLPAGDTTPTTPAVAQYHHLEDSGAVIYDLVFAPEQGGATAYLVTWYINPTGQAGPPSEPLVFQILGLPPGKGVIN